MVEDQQHGLSDFEIDRSISGVGIPVTYDPSSGTIELEQYTYEIVNPETGIAAVVHIPFELLSTLNAVKALLHFGFKNPPLRDDPSCTWPDRWEYFSEDQLEQLERLGLPVRSQGYILTDSLGIRLFGAGLYHHRGVQQFLDSWVELIWQEYVLEIELRRYRDLRESGQTIVTIDRAGEFNFQNANTWIPLENCAVRIRSIWERLQTYIISLYFTGDLAPPNANRQYWMGVDDVARGMMNSEQVSFYEHIFDFIRSIDQSPLKRLRDALIHNLSPRPPGAAPVSSELDASLPQTVDGLGDLVQRERSRTREALIAMAAIIRFKRPPNRRIRRNSS